MQSLRFSSIVLFGAAAVAQVPWTTFRGNARHDGAVPVTLNPAALVQRWEINTNNGWLNQVASADGKVFVTGSGKRIMVLNASTGAQLWSLHFSTANSVNPPAYDNGRVYLQTGNHSTDTYLRCYNATTGSLLFQSPHTAQWENYLAPTIVNGNAYVNGGTYGGMYGFNGTSGQQLWFNNQLPQYDDWTPAVQGNVAYAYVGGTLYACSTATGAINYTIQDSGFSWAGWSMNLAPVLGGQNDCFIIHSGNLVRFDLQTRTVSYRLGGNFTGQPVIKDGVVYAIAGSVLRAIEQGTGTNLWTFGLPSQQLRDTLAVLQGHVLVRTETTTHLIDLQTRQSVWSTPRAGDTTVGENAIYIAQSNGTLTAIGFAALPTPTSMMPRQTHYTAPPVAVTIQGNGFSLGTGLEVRFGGTLATQVVVVDDQTITCVAPPRGPGLVDIALSNSLGQTVLPNSFAYTPAMHTGGILLPGGRIDLSCFQAPNEIVFCAYGVQPTSVVIPPFVGSLGLADPNLLFVLQTWPTPRFDLTVPIPSNPLLSGAQLMFQSLVGLNVAVGDATFSNTRTVTIQ